MKFTDYKKKKKIANGEDRIHCQITGSNQFCNHMGKRIHIFIKDKANYANQSLLWKFCC